MTMKLSDRFKSDSVACVVSLRDLVEFDDIDIPDVQRGLVWNPTQIANLWESIFSGYPIGALTLYQQEGKWQLIDGQQRRHAIKLGLQEPDLKMAMATLWTRWGKDGQYEGLMVCTRRHPWGFKWNQDKSKLEKLSHKDMIITWENMMQKGDNPFIIPDMSDSSDYWESKGMIPLYRILAKEKHSSVPEPVWQKTEEWRERVNADSLPLIRFCPTAPNAADDGKSRIHELFTRINKGGTEISAEDYTYSTLCSYMGSEFKTNINTIAEDFLPPSRVARIYARLVYAAVRLESLKEPDSPSFWQVHNKHDTCISRAISKTKMLLIDAGVPASIHLAATSDEWLTVMCWCMWKFPELTGSATDKKLLCMLPYVVCRGPEFHSSFCKKFHEAFREGDKPCGILHLAAIGTAYAACYSQETGMYPLCEPSNPRVQSSYDYDDEWLMACLNQDNKGVLHFIQSSYMNKLLLPKCGFYPHEKATWGNAMNRPWDEDHIVPQSLWWRLEPDEPFFQECLANKQMLYYRHNRSKSNSLIGAPQDASANPMADFCYPEAGLGEVKLYDPRPGALRTQRRNEVRPDYAEYLAGYKSVVNLRFGAMVQKLWKELGIAQLVDTINEIPTMEQVPDCLKLAVECWRYLESLPDAENLKWCAIRHDGSRQQEILTKDFYHSLCSWLAVGKVENGAFRCFCWQRVNARTLNIEGGLRRLPNLSRTEWLQGETKDNPRNDWWVDVPGSYQATSYSLGEGGSSLKEEVEKVRPEDLFEIDHDMKVVYP